MGRQKIHFQAPDAEKLDHEMQQFIQWFNTKTDIDPIIKAAISHLWFVTIHPFDDGNGRIARAITDIQLARADKSIQRFYSMSAQIRIERNEYYNILETTQKETINVTAWVIWFLNCLHRAMSTTNKTLEKVIQKAKFWENPITRSLNERQRKLLNRMIDGFDGKLTSSKWAKIAKCSQDTAIRDINDLIEKRVLVKEPAGGRSTSYLLNSDIFH